MRTDPDEAATNVLDPLRPRPIDLPTPVPLPGPGRGDRRLDPAVFDLAKVLAAPDDPDQWPAWRGELEALAQDARRRTHHHAAAYDALPWAARCRVAAQVWLWDERLYDWSARRFTPDRLLAAYADLGGLDGLVLWHAYPCLGIDDRNQFDWYRDVPGLVELVADLRGRGVRVFLDYNPWDVGTRREAVPDGQALREVADLLGADGVFLDTLKHADEEFLGWMGGARPLALEGESRAPTERLVDHVLSWAQWFADSTAPGVMRARLVERRHLLHSVRRWHRSHAEELQSSWMNGVGVLVWDAVFGVWVGWNERDRSTLRGMNRVQRAAHDVLEKGAWEPLAGATPEAARVGVYGSTFTLGEVTLVTLVNRSPRERTGPLVPAGVLAGASAWDVTAGRPVRDDVSVPAHGITGVVAVRGPVPGWVADVVEAAAQDEPATGTAFPARESRLVPVPRSAADGPPAEVGAVALTPGVRTLTRRWRRRETGLLGEAPYVEEWKPLPPRLHDEQELLVRAELGPVLVAGREVSVADVEPWCRESGRPVPPGEPEAPANHLDLDDARAYARHVGARLPTDAEWQAAAGEPGFGRTPPLVWEWTESERTDGVTRRVLLKGGSERAVTGSDWYADGGPQAPERVLAWLRTGLDRSPAIGFRLAWDGAVLS